MVLVKPMVDIRAQKTAFDLCPGVLVTRSSKSNLDFFELWSNFTKSYGFGYNQPAFNNALEYTLL